MRIKVLLTLACQLIPARAVDGQGWRELQILRTSPDLKRKVIWKSASAQIGFQMLIVILIATISLLVVLSLSLFLVISARGSDINNMELALLQWPHFYLFDD